MFKLLSDGFGCFVALSVKFRDVFIPLIGFLALPLVLLSLLLLLLLILPDYDLLELSFLPEHLFQLLGFEECSFSN